MLDTNHKNDVFGDKPKNIITGLRNLEMYSMMPYSVRIFCNNVKRYTKTAMMTTFFKVLKNQSFNMIINVSSSCMVFMEDDVSKLPGMILFKTQAKMKADNVLIATILKMEEPVLCCTVVSTIMLCEHNTMTDKMVAALVLRSKVVITAIAE